MKNKGAADPLADLALVLRTQGKYAGNRRRDGAIKTLALHQKLLGNNNANVGWSLFGLGITLAAEGRLAEAESSVARHKSSSKIMMAQSTGRGPDVYGTGVCHATGGKTD